MLAPMMEGLWYLLGGCLSHRERTRAESVGWVYMYSASGTCVWVNQGDIKFGRDRGAPIRLSGASDS